MLNKIIKILFIFFLIIILIEFGIYFYVKSNKNVLEKGSYSDPKVVLQKVKDLERSDLFYPFIKSGLIKQSKVTNYYQGNISNLQYNQNIDGVLYILIFDLNFNNEELRFLLSKANFNKFSFFEKNKDGVLKKIDYSQLSEGDFIEMVGTSVFVLDQGEIKKDLESISIMKINYE
ncbi:MAG: hypothetical protein KatS3mg091_649 [Patescibacteria group bacterium]|nr:MAG: hypothetical protein KatS3mg091_649 [Patescibacteria group bacterium]